MGSCHCKQTEPEQTRFKTVFTIPKCVAQNLSNSVALIRSSQGATDGVFSCYGYGPSVTDGDAEQRTHDFKWAQPRYLYHNFEFLFAA